MYYKNLNEKDYFNNFTKNVLDRLYEKEQKISNNRWISKIVNMNLNAIKFYLIVLVFTTSCQNEKDTKDKFARYSLSLLNSDEPIEDIYLMPKDSISIHDTTILVSLRRLNDKHELSKYIKQQNYEIKAWRDISQKLNFKNSKIEFLRTEIDTVESFNYYSKKTNLTVYFLSNKKEYFFKLKDVDSLKGKWTAREISEPISREDFALTPYTPIDIYFDDYTWTYHTNSPFTFTNFHLKISNNTPNNFKRLKFRLTIRNGLFGEKLFSKIITINEPISHKDYFPIEIYELCNFYIGTNIACNPCENINITTELIDAKPRPGFEDLPF